MRPSPSLRFKLVRFGRYGSSCVQSLAHEQDARFSSCISIIRKDETQTRATFEQAMRGMSGPLDTHL